MDTYFVIEIIFRIYEEGKKEKRFFFSSSSTEIKESVRVFHRIIRHSKPSELALVNPHLWVDQLSLSPHQYVWIFDTQRDLWLVRVPSGEYSLEEFKKDSLGNWREGYFKIKAGDPYREEKS